MLTQPVCIQSRLWKLIVILILGFASGLPLALTAATLQAWLATSEIDMATIGLFSLVGLPYTFKFLWAPLMDRFEPPKLGRRRGWLVLTQLGLAAALFGLSGLTPTTHTEAFALMAVLIAFFAASQDIVIDAYRTDILSQDERGLGASLGVLGYRLAMILSGGIAFIWADTQAGYGWSWPEIYQLFAMIMLGLAVFSLLLLPSVAKNNQAPKTAARHDLQGFIAVVFAVAIGYYLTSHVLQPSTQAILQPILTEDNLKKWVDMLSLLLGVAITLPLVLFAARKAQFETLNLSLKNYFTLPGAGHLLLFIILYKLGDAFAGSLTTAFLLKGVLFSQAEIGVVNKVIGMWLTIFGAILGGLLMMRLGLFKSLLLFGVLQLLSNFGFYLLAVLGKGAWGGFDLPAFDWWIVSLKQATQVDILLLAVVGFENITGGMGTAAFVAFLMALCNQKFTATQYALLSAFAAIGRVWVGPMAGVLSETVGWSSFFIFSAIAAIPGLIYLWKMRTTVRGLDQPSLTDLAKEN